MQDARGAGILTKSGLSRIKAQAVIDRRNELAKRQGEDAATDAEKSKWVGRCEYEIKKAAVDGYASVEVLLKRGCINSQLQVIADRVIAELARRDFNVVLHHSRIMTGVDEWDDMCHFVISWKEVTS